MKTVFLAIFLATLLLAGGRAQAQVYDAYYYWDGGQYQQYWPQSSPLYSYGAVDQYAEQLYDPYYQLHVLHYQLYLPQNQVYNYPSYVYSPCCFGGVILPPRAVPVRRFPRDVPRSLRPLPLPPLPAAVTSRSAAPIRIR